MSKKNQDDYLRDLQDWQDHQYSPGYFTGGRIPPQIKHGRKRMGYYYLILGVYASFAFIFTVFSGSFSWRNLLLLLWPACMVAVALRFFKREKEHQEVHKKKHKHKKGKR